LNDRERDAIESLEPDGVWRHTERLTYL
jgi:hypothetical protein